LRKNDPKPTLDKYAFQLSEGVDLMEIDGVGRSLVLTILCETGFDLSSKFASHNLAKFYSSIAYKSGKKAAITATARKIAVIVYKMLENKQPYKAQNMEEYQEQLRKRKIKSIQKAMLRMNIKLDELNVT